MARLHTSEWLTKHNLHYDHLAISHDKTATARDLIDMNPDYRMGRVFTLEDHLKNFDQYAEAGYNSYLMDATWNQERETGFRVTHVAEFVNVVQEALDASDSVSVESSASGTL